MLFHHLCNFFVIYENARTPNVYQVEKVQVTTTIIPAPSSSSTNTSHTKKVTAFGEDSLLFPIIIRAISENIGKGTEYNNNLIDDPGATLTKIVTATKLSYPELKHSLRLLSDQGLVTVGVYQKKRMRRRKKGGKLIRTTVTTAKVTHKGYKYLEQK